MCGLSGYTGVDDYLKRLRLVIGLGAGIDKRGGHSCGYVGVGADPGPRYARKEGTWISSKMRFLRAAADNTALLMHARWATCGIKHLPTQAHPFAIRRNGQVVLWGAHNGVISNAWESANKHDRKIEVDSQEIFELLADGDFEGIRQLRGYGMITWINAGENHVNATRLSDHSDFDCVQLTEGGIVWGSTWQIISQALDGANLRAECSFELKEVGRVYEIYPDRVVKSPIDGVHLSKNNWWGHYADMDDWDNEWLQYGGMMHGSRYRLGQGSTTNQSAADEDTKRSWERWNDARDANPKGSFVYDSKLGRWCERD